MLASHRANLRRAGVLLLLVATGCSCRALDARRLEARVTSESGDEVPALVRLEPPVASQFARDGRVSIAFPAGLFAVGVSSPGMATLRLELEAPRAGLDLGNLPLVRAQPVEGRVLDPQGAPVARAIVQIERSGGFGTFRGSATTEADGHFMVLDAPPPPARLIVRAPGWAPWEMEIGDEGESIDVRLGRGRIIRGTVRNADGAPVAGAWIGSGLARARSGTDGTFSIHAGAGERWIVARDGVQRALAEADEPVTLTLRPPAALVGVIRDAVTRQPVTGVRIRVERRHRAGPVSWVERQDVLAADQAAGDRAGRFALGGLLPGAASVRFEAEGYLPEERSISLVRARAVALELSLRRRPVLHGRAIDPAGRPLPHAQIEALDRGGHRTVQRASGDGRFRLSVLPAPRVRIRARAAGLAGQVEIDVDAAEGAMPGELRVELHRTVRASGRIYQDSGEPAAAARVRLLEHPNGAPRTAWATADALGGFSFEELSRGTYILQARHARHALAHQEVEITSTASPIEVHLERAAPISGRVTSGGEPLIGAIVSAHWRDVQRTAMAGTDGRFVFDEAPPNTSVVLVANAAGLIASSKVVEAPASDVELALGKPATLSGAVVDAAGRPQHVFDVTLTPTGDAGSGMRPVPFQQRFTNKAGRFAVRGLSDASYELVISAPGGEHARREIRLASGEQSDLAQIMTTRP